MAHRIRDGVGTQGESSSFHLLNPSSKKNLLKKVQNNTVHIKEYQALAKSLGVPFSNKKIVELEVDLGYIDTSGAFTTITEKMRGRGGGR